MSRESHSSGYAVMVDDNFNYMDEDERYCAGRFPTYELAVAMAKSLVIQFFKDSDPKSNAETLASNYRSFGEDPFIVPFGGAPMPPVQFSAWDFAEEVAKGVCDFHREKRARQAPACPESAPVTLQSSRFPDIEDPKLREALEAFDAVLPEASKEEINPGTQETP